MSKGNLEEIRSWGVRFQDSNPSLAIKFFERGAELEDAFCMASLSQICRSLLDPTKAEHYEELLEKVLKGQTQPLKSEEAKQVDEAKATQEAQRLGSSLPDSAELPVVS